MNRFTPKPARQKPFTWTYSKLKNFEACQFKHQQVDLLKTFQEAESDELREGNQTHEAMKLAIEKGQPLPEKFERWQYWVDRLTPKSNETALVELKLAITRDLKPCGYFADDVWFRCVVDLFKLSAMPSGRTLGLAVDYKTGKIIEDSVQLALSAQSLFVHYPQVKAIRTDFIWLKFDNAQTTETFTPADMASLWEVVLPRVEAMEYAYNHNLYVPMPGRLCRKWCPVSSCEYYSK
jgi:hypothetical protein